MCDDEDYDDEDYFYYDDGGRTEFIASIMKKCETLEDIEKVILEGAHWNMGEYMECSAINDSELCKLAETIVKAQGDELEKAKKDFLDYIKNSNYFALVDESRVVSAAKDIFEKICSEETISDIREIDMKTKKIKRYTEYYL